MPRAGSNVFGVLRNMDVRRMWIAGVISDVGNFVTFVALAIRVHDLTGHLAAVGLVFALRSIPWFTLGPIAGVFVDRADRRLVMVGSDLARALLVASLAFTTHMWQLYLLAFASGSFGPLFRPARQAILPTVVSGQDYVNAIAINEVAHQGLHTVGPAIGGAAVLLVGARHAFLIDAATFLISASLCLGISVRGRPAVEPASFGTVKRDIKAGAELLARDRILRTIISSRAATLIGDAGMTALLVGYVRTVLHHGSGTYGIALAVGGIGTAVFSYVLARMGPAVRRTPLLIIAAASPLLFAPLWLKPSLGVLLILMALEGTAITGLALFDDVIVAENSPEQMRGRIFSLSGATSELADFSGSIVFGVLGDAIGPAAGLGVAGLASAVLGVIALAPGLGRLRQSDRERTSG